MSPPARAMAIAERVLAKEEGASCSDLERPVSIFDKAEYRKAAIDGGIGGDSAMCLVCGALDHDEPSVCPYRNLPVGMWDDIRDFV